MVRKKLCLAVDQGGTKMMIGAVDSEGKIYASKRYPTGVRNQQEMADIILNGIEDFLSAEDLGNGEAAAVGMGIVGQIDAENGIWSLMYNLESDRPIHFADMVERRFGIPCFIDNDVKAATAAELEIGIGKECNHFIYLNIGTGIAAGIVCEGKIIRGYRNNAGEVGHMIVDPYSGVRCSCGKIGCVESIASGRGIEQQYRRLLKEFPESALHKLSEEEEICSEIVFESALKGDELAMCVADKAIDAIALLIGNLITTFNPEQIVLGGGGYLRMNGFGKV